MSMFYPRTNFTAEQLRPRLEHVRANGWAESDEDLQYGVHAIAAPIRSENLSVVAAIGIGVHTTEVSKEVVRDKYLPLVLEAAKNIETDWRKCAELPNSMAALNLDGLQLLHLRRENS